MKIQDFANKIGVSKQTMSKILSGRYDTSKKTAREMALILRFPSAGVLMDWLEKDPKSVRASIKALPD